MVELTVNPGREADFLTALMAKLQGAQARAAFWFYEPVVLPLTAEFTGGASPFPGSGTSLAGVGHLLPLTAANAAALAVFFARDTAALSALIHIEIESDGQIQFRSYDSFAINLPGPALDSLWLSSLASRGIITIE